MVCDHLDLSNRTKLRTISKVMQHHLHYILRGNFESINCPLLPAERNTMEHFKRSPLAKEVVYLTWSVYSSEEVLEQLSTSYTPYTPTKEDGRRQRAAEMGQRQRYTPFTRLGYSKLREANSSLIQRAFDSLPNLQHMAFLFGHPKSLALSPPRIRPGASKDESERRLEFIRSIAGLAEGRLSQVGIWNRMQLWTYTPLLIGGKDVAVSYTGGVYFDTHSGDVGYGRICSFAQSISFCKDMGYRLQHLELDAVPVGLQHLEFVAKRTETLRTLWLKNCLIQVEPEDLNHGFGPADFDGPFNPADSRLLAQLRKLTVLQCFGSAVAMRNLIRIFQPLSRHGRLKKLQFEAGGLLFDSENDGVLDGGSKLPAVIEKLGISGALKRMDECWKLSMAPA